MEICPYCDAGLTYDCEYGYLGSNQKYDIEGYIYKCPNSEGFNSEEEAKD